MLLDNQKYQYEVEVDENLYSYERSDNMQMTEQERIDKTQEGILRSFENRLPDMNIYELLNKPK